MLLLSVGRSIHPAFSKDELSEYATVIRRPVGRMAQREDRHPAHEERQGMKRRFADEDDVYSFVED